MKVLAFSLLFFAVSCAPVPEVRHPTPDFPVPSSWSAGFVLEGRVDTLWWREFDDPRLKGLISEALAYNHDLKIAAVRLRAAQAQARIAGAPLQPQVALTGTGSRRRQNYIGLPFPGASRQVLSSTVTTYGVSFNVSWEADLWGRLRAGQAAALADLQAARADLQAARLSLIAQTIRAFFAAVEAGRQVALAQATVEEYRLSVDRIQSRYERGLRPLMDLRAARAGLAGAEAILYQRRQQQDQILRQLELLLGRYPSAAVEVGAELPEVRAVVPAGLPADLVRRRPDLAAAERRLAAADRRLAEARAALYPHISLTASGGRSSKELKDLLDGDFAVWNLVANLTQPILQGGRLRGGVEMARAGKEQALIQYARSVLKAYAEVESALAAEQFLAGREQALQAAAAEARETRLLAEERYEKGLLDLVNLLEIRRREHDSESRLLALRRMRLDARIDLHLALGGGFSADEPSLSSDPISHPEDAP